MKFAATSLLLVLSLAGCYSPPPLPSQTYVRGPVVSPGITSQPSAPAGPAACDEWLSAKETPIADLFGQLQRAIRPKGEFETTAAFNDRAQSAIATIESGLTQRNGLDQIVAVHRVPPGNIGYNADTGMLKIHSVLPWNTLFGYRNFVSKDLKSFSPDVDFMPVQTSEARTGSYVGSNAFGATTTVAQYRGTEYGVALMEAKQGESWAKQRDGVTIGVPPDQAQALKGRVGIKVVGKIVPPGWFEGVTGDSPTMRNPTDRSITARYVAINSTCAAVVDLGSGAVLRRLR